jgi:hypothetical protein
MRYRKLTASGDYSFGNGALDFYVNTPEAVAQAIETTLKFFLGEWYLNVNDGTPWVQSILGFHSQEDADEALIQVVYNVQGVQNVSNWQSTYDPETRQYTSISAIVDTIYGQTVLDISNLGGL